MALSSKSVRTPAFHAGNPGSNPGSVTKEKQKFLLTKQMCGYFETLNETLTEHGFLLSFQLPPALNLGVL